MEKIKIGEIITLDNGKEYVCVFEMEKEGLNYIYLVTQTRPIKVKFAKYSLSDENITIIGSVEEKNKVYKMFQEEMSNFIEK